MRPRYPLLVLALASAGLGLGGLLVVLRPAAVRAQSPVPGSSLIWPISGSATPDTGSISSPFGPRWQASQHRYDYHPGIDIAAPLGTPIHVITDGVVSRVYTPSLSSGLTILVRHSTLNLYSAYLHLSGAAVKEGQVVTRGRVIGYVGDSGTTDFMHLHFEIRLPSPPSPPYPATTRNPMGYLSHAEVAAPLVHIADLRADPLYSPVVTLTITAPREELDLNRIRVILQDRASGAVLDDRLVDFNERLHTGADELDQDGIRLIPSVFNAHSETLQYELKACFYSLHGFDSFTLTAEARDLDGHATTDTRAMSDTMPPGRVTSLRARWLPGDDVRLSWLAPGDSGSVGQAESYEVRYAGQEISDANWGDAIPLPSPPEPLQAGQTQSWVLHGPFPAEVWFALRASDPEGNASPISNSAQAAGKVSLPLVAR